MFIVSISTVDKKQMPCTKTEEMDEERRKKDRKKKLVDRLVWFRDRVTLKLIQKKILWLPLCCILPLHSFLFGFSFFIRCYFFVAIHNYGCFRYFPFHFWFQWMQCIVDDRHWTRDKKRKWKKTRLKRDSAKSKLVFFFFAMRIASSVCAIVWVHTQSTNVDAIISWGWDRERSQRRRVNEKNQAHDSFDLTLFFKSFYFHFHWIDSAIIFFLPQVDWNAAILRFLSCCAVLFLWMCGWARRTYWINGDRVFRRSLIRFYVLWYNHVVHH